MYCRTNIKNLTTAEFTFVDCHDGIILCRCVLFTYCDELTLAKSTTLLEG
jgi:hypothetical protein